VNVCVADEVLVTVTVAPDLTVSVDGENAKPLIVTAVPPAASAGAALEVTAGAALDAPEDSTGAALAAEDALVAATAPESVSFFFDEQPPTAASRTSAAALWQRMRLIVASPISRSVLMGT
jgi:predicted nucleic acid-binding protein